MFPKCTINDSSLTSLTLTLNYYNNISLIYLLTAYITVVMYHEHCWHDWIFPTHPLWMEQRVSITVPKFSRYIRVFFFPKYAFYFNILPYLVFCCCRPRLSNAILAKFVS